MARKKKPTAQQPVAADSAEPSGQQAPPQTVDQPAVTSQAPAVQTTAAPQAPAVQIAAAPQAPASQPEVVPAPQQLQAENLPETLEKLTVESKDAQPAQGGKGGKNKKKKFKALDTQALPSQSAQTMQQIPSPQLAVEAQMYHSQQQPGPPYQQQMRPQQPRPPYPQQMHPQQQMYPQQHGPPFPQQFPPQQQGQPYPQMPPFQQQMPAYQQRMPLHQQQQRPPHQQQMPLPPQQQQMPLPPQQQQMPLPPQQQQMPLPPQQQQMPLPPHQQQMPLPPQQLPGPQQQLPAPQQQLPAPQQQLPEPQQQKKQKGPKQQQPKKAQPAAPPQNPTPAPQQQAPKEQSPPVETAVAKTKKEEYGLQIPKRVPCPNKRGMKVVIETNYFNLVLAKRNDVIHYDVCFDPDKPPKLYPLIMKQYLDTYFPKRHPAFDGGKNLYSSGPLFDSTAFINKVLFKEEGRLEPKTYEIKLQYAATIKLEQLFQYLKSGTSKDPPQNTVQAMDIILRHSKMYKFVKVGRSFYSPPTGSPYLLGGGLEMWYGQFQSVIMGWKPFVNIDVAHKGFSVQQPVTELVKEFDNRVDLKRKLDDRIIMSLKKYLKNIKVIFQVPNDHTTKRELRVADISTQSANEYYFEFKEKKINITTYFANERRCRLQYPNLPCLIVKTQKNSNYYPMELCIVKGGQVIGIQMDGNQTTNLIRKAATPAGFRKQKIQDIFQQSAYQNDPVLKEFGITVSGNFEKVDARILVPPKLQYKDAEISVRNGVWMPGKFKENARLSNWCIISLARTDNSKIQYMVNQLQMGGKDLGVEIAQPQIHFGELRNLNSLLREAVANRCQLAMVIVNPFGEDYAKVKQNAELSVGILTQCIKKNTVERMNINTAKMLLQKINSKLDGVNHCLAQISKPLCLKVPCMIVGADVTHPSPRQENVPSIAAVACSHDPQGFKYNICLRLQPPTEEIIADLKNVMKEQLIYFYKKTNRKPEKIVMFRDGVSEGMFSKVLNSELMSIRGACTSLQPDYKPMITIVIVQKRHHTRFFPTNPKDGDKNGNAPAGTCVDSIITHPTELDFYLLSHQSIQGTARPTRYHLIWDDSNMNEDELEHLTYYLCHIYTRCTRAVSYPTPTYYAHWAANRASVLITGVKIDLTRLNDFQKNIRIMDNILKDSPMFFV